MWSPLPDVPCEAPGSVVLFHQILLLGEHSVVAGLEVLIEGPLVFCSQTVAFLHQVLADLLELVEVQVIQNGEVQQLGVHLCRRVQNVSSNVCLPTLLLFQVHPAVHVLHVVRELGVFAELVELFALVDLPHDLLESSFHARLVLEKEVELLDLRLRVDHEREHLVDLVLPTGVAECLEEGSGVVETVDSSGALHAPCLGCLEQPVHLFVTSFQVVAAEVLGQLFVAYLHSEERPVEELLVVAQQVDVLLVGVFDLVGRLEEETLGQVHPRDPVDVLVDHSFLLVESEGLLVLLQLLDIFLGHLLVHQTDLTHQTVPGPCTPQQLLGIQPYLLLLEEEHEFLFQFQQFAHVELVFLGEVPDDEFLLGGFEVDLDVVVHGLVFGEGDVDELGGHFYVERVEEVFLLGGVGTVELAEEVLFLQSVLVEVRVEVELGLLGYEHELPLDPLELFHREQLVVLFHEAVEGVQNSPVLPVESLEAVHHVHQEQHRLQGQTPHSFLPQFHLNLLLPLHQHPFVLLPQQRTVEQVLRSHSYVVVEQLFQILLLALSLQLHRHLLQHLPSGTLRSFRRETQYLSKGQHQYNIEMDQIYQEIEEGKHTEQCSQGVMFLSQEDEDSAIVSIRAAIRNGNIEEYKEKVQESQEDLEQSIKGIVRQSQQQIIENLTSYLRASKQAKTISQEISKCDSKIERILIRNKFDNQEISKKENQLQSIDSQMKEYESARQQVKLMRKCEQHILDGKFISAARMFRQIKALPVPTLDEQLAGSILAFQQKLYKSIEQKLASMIQQWSAEKQAQVGQQVYEQGVQEQQRQSVQSVTRESHNELTILQSVRVQPVFSTAPVLQVDFSVLKQCKQIFKGLQKLPKLVNILEKFNESQVQRLLHEKVSEPASLKEYFFGILGLLHTNSLMHPQLAVSRSVASQQEAFLARLTPDLEQKTQQYLEEMSSHSQYYNEVVSLMRLLQVLQAYVSKELPAWSDKIALLMLKAYELFVTDFIEKYLAQQEHSLKEMGVYFIQQSLILCSAFPLSQTRQVLSQKLHQVFYQVYLQLKEKATSQTHLLEVTGNLLRVKAAGESMRETLEYLENQLEGQGEGDESLGFLDQLRMALENSWQEAIGEAIETQMMVHCKETKDAQRENKVAGLIKTIRKVLKVLGEQNLQYRQLALCLFYKGINSHLLKLLTTPAPMKHFNVIMVFNMSDDLLAAEKALQTYQVPDSDYLSRAFRQVQQYLEIILQDKLDRLSESDFLATQYPLVQVDSLRAILSKLKKTQHKYSYIPVIRSSTISSALKVLRQ